MFLIVRFYNDATIICLPTTVLEGHQNGKPGVSNFRKKALSGSYYFHLDRKKPAVSEVIIKSTDYLVVHEKS